MFVKLRLNTYQIRIRNCPNRFILYPRAWFYLYISIYFHRATHVCACDRRCVFLHWYLRRNIITLLMRNTYAACAFIFANIVNRTAKQRSEMGVGGGREHMVTPNSNNCKHFHIWKITRFLFIYLRTKSVVFLQFCGKRLSQLRCFFLFLP